MVGVSRTDFILGFEGEAARGEMDAADLAPMLLAWVGVIEAANQTLNEDRARARVYVRASEEGRFLVSLSLDIGLVEQLTGLLDAMAAHQAGITAAQDLMDLLLKAGAVGGSVVYGAMKLIEKLRGRRPEKVSEGEDGGALLIIDGEKIEVSREMRLLLGSLPFREAAARLGEKLEELKGIDEAFIEERRGKRLWSLRRERARDLRLPPPEEEEPQTVTSRRTAWLELVSTHFRPGYKWRFSDGEQTFTADMMDEDFLQRVENGDIALSAADKLLCEIEEEQELGAELKKRATRILRVLDYRPGAKQMRLI